MIPEEAWQILPSGSPLELAPWVQAAIAQANLSERQARAYAWAHHILASSRDALAFWAFENLTEDLTAGFIRFGKSEDEREKLVKSVWGKEPPPFPHVITKDGERWSFGIVIGIRPSAILPLPSIQPVPSLPPTPPILPLPSIQHAAGIAFPVIFEFRSIQYNAPPHPVGNATSTCYVRPRSGKHYYGGSVWTEGILVARHVLANAGVANTGAIVTMDTTPPSNMQVVDIDAATTIDAAILDSGTNSIPATANPSTIISAVAPGQKVTVRGKNNTFSADVIRVMDDPSYFGNMVAHRAFMDTSGVAGDSGAIAELSSGEIVGLYIGAAPSANEGLLQLMNQVCKYFEVDPYR
jgi:hypothetical protein